MVETVEVGIGDLRIERDGHILSVCSLGSCVAAILYDPVNKIGGMVHVILPENSSSNGREFNPRRFADTGIKILVKEIVSAGAERFYLKAYLVGGANLFPTLSQQLAKNIGRENAEAVRRILQKEHIPIIAEDTGGNYGRSIEFYISSGEVWIKSYQHGRKKL